MNVMIVDDSKMIRHMAGIALNELGYDQITEASNVGEAKNLLKGKKFDLIISDWHMPGESGLDFLKYAKSSQEYSAIPFILQTTENEKKNIVEAVKAGVQGYLFKPVQKEALSQKLMELSKVYNFKPPSSTPVNAKTASPSTKADRTSACVSGHSLSDFVESPRLEGNGYSFSVKEGMGMAQTVYCGDVLRQFSGELRKKYASDQVVLLCDSETKNDFKEFTAALEKELNCFTVTVPEIKKNRTVTQYGALIDALTGKKISYSSVIVALGDAPLLSLAGFTAATYGGGAPLIIVPVSLASFLDSCFNGTWELHGVQGLKSSQLEYNPSMVWFDTGSFVKLSDNDYVMACSEIIRYAFIGGEEMAQIAIQQWTSLLKKEPAVVADFLRLCFATRVSLGALKMEKATRNAAVRFAQPLAEALKALGMKKPLSSGQALYRAIACMCEAGKRAGTLAPQSAGVYMDLLKMMPSFQLPEPFNCRTVYTTAFKSDPLRTTSPLIALPWCAGSVVVRDDIGETEYIEAFKGLLCPEQG